jgi:hypothetical protein
VHLPAVLSTGIEKLQVVRNGTSSAALAQEVLQLAVAKGCDGLVVGVPVQQHQQLADWQRDSPQVRPPAAHADIAHRQYLVWATCACGIH